LRNRRKKSGIDTPDLGALARRFQKFGDVSGQEWNIITCPVLQNESETASCSDTLNGWRRKYKGNRAWNLRKLAEAAKVTPEVTPRWLLPRSYYVGFLTAQANWLTESFVKNPDVVRSVFRSSTGRFGGINDGPLEHDTYIAPWQEEFHAFIFGWLTLMGYPGWESIFRSAGAERYLSLQGGMSQSIDQLQVLSMLRICIGSTVLHSPLTGR